MNEKLKPIFIMFIQYLISINKYEFKQSDFREYLIVRKKKYSSLYEELLENGKIDKKLNDKYQQRKFILSILKNNEIISVLKRGYNNICLINVELFENYIYLEKEKVEFLVENSYSEKETIEIGNKDYKKKRAEKIKKDYLLADSFEKKQIAYIYKATEELNSAQPFKKFNVDHAISVFYCIKNNLIAHCISNLQILTKSDNNSKLTNSDHFFSEKFTKERQIAYVKGEFSFYLTDDNVSLDQKKKIEEALIKFEVYMQFVFDKI